MTLKSGKAWHKISGVAMNLPEILGENIAQRRKKLGLNQEQVVERLGVTPEAMTRIEKGEIALQLTRLEAIEV